MAFGMAPAKPGALPQGGPQKHGAPGPAAQCNVGPDETDYLAVLEIVAQDSRGECQANVAPFGGQYYELGTVVFTGVDNVVSTAGAINIISDITPSITGTYTFSFPVPHTSISVGSPVAVYVGYSIPGYGIFATSTSSWTENHLPTIALTASTTTSTTPSTVFATSTSTSTVTTTATITPAAVTTTVITGTVTVRATTPITTTTVTITPRAKVVYTLSRKTVTSTVTCFANWPRRRDRQDDLIARDAPNYQLPNCGPVVTATVYTDIVTQFEPSMTTVTETGYETATVSTTTTLGTVTKPVNGAAVTTVTPRAVTWTVKIRAARPTSTRTIVIVVTKLVIPRGKKTPLCRKAPKPPVLLQNGPDGQCPLPVKKHSL
ncbi:uncharacterized protein B0I36DRAFT_380772 [Microdochium trichocladiopsis]|uniref:Uncharacterized protein n=1 Tax=Microdochium trichocladiopsis TaxID=1682393 RepID=A0A9P9BUG3_9PEZI|nr:uncharacterized protein B0I36DRAFT_380772 [Microdochium trichocladiopsis]KAH7037601.1 hypothetical protein B0I36DRAFT_380772 [Microdochium trichocladiopsis]